MTLAPTVFIASYKNLKAQVLPNFLLLLIKMDKRYSDIWCVILELA